MEKKEGIKMEFETLKKSHKKEILIGAVVFILIAVVLIVRLAFAKYQTVQSIPIVSGTINYTMPDFDMVAIYQQKSGSTCTEDSCYEAVDRMPSTGYAINESKSYCNVNNTKDTNAKLSTNENGKHEFSNLQKGSKCYVYFDKDLILRGSQGILANVTVNEGTPDFNTVATTNEGVYKAKDDDGDTYYFRGTITNNYVKFANKFWRIIRINGDGSIRLIYQGTSASSTGIDAQIGTSKFNTSYDNNMYVGFEYTSGQAQGTGTESTILGVLNTWYESNLMSYTDKLDINAGFCGDRRRSTTNGGAPNGSGGTGTTKTYYAARYRLETNKSPELSCEEADFYTVTIASKGNKSLKYPIGLITADEVAMAGGVHHTGNSSYYLYTGSVFWTMSPYYYYNDARVFDVSSSGTLTAENKVHATYGVRPVINLRSDIKLTGSGTASDPYVVVDGNS